MFDASSIGEVIRFPFILIRDIFTFLIKNIVPIILVGVFVLFLYWFLCTGVRDRLIKALIESRENKRKKKEEVLCHS